MITEQAVKLYRLDACHSAGDGEFAKYYRDRAGANAADQRFVGCGWLCDFYPVELSIDENVARQLVAGVWPNEADAKVLELIAGNPIAKVRRELKAVLENLQERKRNAK